MVPKIKERWINTGLAIFSGAAVAFFMFFLNSTAGRSLRMRNELNKKANTEWVKEQDSIWVNHIKEEEKTYRAGVAAARQAEFNLLNWKIDLMMQYWNIVPDTTQSRYVYRNFNMRTNETTTKTPLFRP